MLTTPLVPRSPLADVADIWEVLDRHLQQLAQTSDVGHQVRLTLEAVRSGLGAEAVLVYSGGQVQDLDGPPGAEPDSYLPLARQLVAQAGTGDSQALVTGRPGASPTSQAALVRLSRSRGAWLVALRQGPSGFTAADLQFMGLARRMLQQQQQQQASQDRLKEVVFNLVHCLTAALDARDPYTSGHSERVARIAVRIAQELRLPQCTRSEIYLGGLLHDIGKIGVPDAVLRKPGKLTAEEFDQIKQHPVIGDAIISHVRQFAHLRHMVRNHHEAYDGTGYPDRLAGEAIPLLARVMAVADASDAMMSDRPYRSALPRERIEAILREGAGKQWDPHLIEAFFACREDVYAIGAHGLGDSVFRAVEDALGGPVPEALRTLAGVVPCGV